MMRRMKELKNKNKHLKRYDEDWLKPEIIY